jgi:hypothetical protein
MKESDSAGIVYLNSSLQKRLISEMNRVFKLGNSKEFLKISNAFAKLCQRVCQTFSFQFSLYPEARSISLLFPIPTSVIFPARNLDRYDLYLSRNSFGSFSQLSIRCWNAFSKVIVNPPILFTPHLQFFHLLKNIHHHKQYICLQDQQ